MKTKNYIALLLLVLISVKTLLVPVAYLDFELRKEYIIQNLCENRFKPQMNCNGHCYLAKKLQKVAEDNATKETQKKGQSLKKILEEVFDAESIFSLEWAFVPLSSKSIYTFLTENAVSVSSSLFHPPTV